MHSQATMKAVEIAVLTKDQVRCETRLVREKRVLCRRITDGHENPAIRFGAHSSSGVSPVGT